VESDSEDLLLAAAGDEAALRRLLSTWRQIVYATFERTREPSAAVEAAAGVFAELVRTAGAQSGGTPFGDRLWHAVWRTLSHEPPAERVAISTRHLADSVGARTAAMRGAVASLPPAERALFLFTRIGGLSVADAARVMGVSAEEGRSLLVAAFEGIRVSLGSVLDIVASPDQTAAARGAA
jgi:hypothetical protein